MKLELHWVRPDAEVPEGTRVIDVRYQSTLGPCGPQVISEVLVQYSSPLPPPPGV